MKIRTKWVIFIIILITNYIIGDIFTSGIIHNTNLWLILTLIGSLFILLSLILLIIPTNKREIVKAKKYKKELEESGNHLPWEPETVFHAL